MNVRTSPGGRSVLNTVLSDGTSLENLFDVERREAAMRLLSDADVYELELERVFARSWCAIAHESEVPNPGDFVARYIGEDPVIVVRDKAGTINVLLNVCQHRGMQVCRSEAGNATGFRCPYHYWAYDEAGRFLGAPIAKEEMHGDVLSKSELGLRKARVAIYAGMVFGTWDESAPSLDDFLGDIKWYLDLMLDRTTDGFEVVGPPQRFTIHSNWKCASEQAAGDGYHTLGLHRSLLELGVLAGGASIESAPGLYGINVSANGHGSRCIPSRETYLAFAGTDVDGLSPAEKLRLIPPPGLSADRVDELVARFTPEQLQVLADSPPVVCGVFPNSLVTNFYSPMPGGELAVSMSWHAYVPKGPGTFESWNWIFVERGDKSREEINRRSTIFGTGTSGLVEQDDAEAWPSMQRSARGVIGRTQTLKYQALLGEIRPDDWPGPGKVYAGMSKDDNQWNWWLRWYDFMTGKAW
jgi:nitrite reductase/ring-hydroxylating ferredoxin subunit